MAQFIARANAQNLKSLHLLSIGDVGGDGYGISREGFRLVETNSSSPYFADQVFCDFLSISPTNEFALLIRDRMGREAYYDLVVLDLKSGGLFRVHQMGLGERGVKNLSWLSDSAVEYEAPILNEEIQPGLTELPTVSRGKLSLHLEVKNASLAAEVSFKDYGLRY